MGAKLARWFVFSVLIALLPICFTYVYMLTDGKSPSLPDVLARGELLLISVALAADALGDLIASGPSNVGFKIAAGGGCLLTIVFASLYFAVVSTKAAANVNVVFYIS
jgi:hypothetical protein